ncbi:glycyl radical-activating protein [Orenia metallireducens]|uniref:Glycyl radical-activating protein n=1 Tax=Orenia metallireducens TaxID=1413210 RepID=A0A1C0A9L4_9FIRM|nr:glycyl-radical enzyme activating protein [Orenia metallireducens]OCL26965.1 glycyl radical-activating protein [Orenia metallireducens]
MSKGLVTRIERYAAYDGPGIRTVVFLKGCPLRCQWCSSPETQHRGQEFYYDGDSSNRELVGKYMSVEEVVEVVKQDIPFYNQSGGGVTLSGGEVLSQARFTAEILEKCQEEYIHTAIETSGYGSWDNFKQILEFTDLVLFDIKHLDSNKHLEATGVENTWIIDNLKRAAQLNKEIIIRVPVIPGINDSKENISQTIELAQELGIKEIHLLPYHSLGREKYDRLGREYLLEDLESPGDKEMNYLQELIESKGIKVQIGG